MAYKTFANGFPLPASDLNNFLMNQSVIVFADSAARTSAIPSPVEGMLTYLEDTNAYESWNGSAFVNINDNTDAIPKSTVTTAQDLIVADGASSVTRLGVGADDQVLSVVAGAVAWADAAGGGGMTLISSTTLSGSSVTFSSIPATYKDLKIIVRNFKPSDSYEFIVLRFNGNTGGNYFSTASNTAYNINFTSSSMAISGRSNETIGTGLISAEIPDYTNSSTVKILNSISITNDPDTSTSWRLDRIFGAFEVAETISSVTLMVGAGTFTTGTALLYGVN
jgi:hypothetical protein